jgi:hypothetical protein
MSACGTRQTLLSRLRMSAFEGKADIMKVRRTGLTAQSVACDTLRFLGTGGVTVRHSSAQLGREEPPGEVNSLRPCVSLEQPSAQP